MAGKNENGRLVVHTDDTYTYTFGVCNQFDNWVDPNGTTGCGDLNTRTDRDPNTPALIWFIASFCPDASPGVTVVYFGHDHNLPPYYHNTWGLCGPDGSFELPDAGWPDNPGGAGNSVALGSGGVAGDTLFPVYYFDVWGYDGVYYCSDINPVGGYASYVDDSNPPVEDIISPDCMGCVRWYMEGYNNCCPCEEEPPEGACCLVDGSCVITAGLDACMALEGYYEYKGDDTVCEPNPCDQPGACCFNVDGHCEYVLEALCTGDYFIADTDCDPNPCDQPPEACCYPTGLCEYVPPEDCGGEPQGPGTDCDPNPCPPPGACCFANGDCEYTLETLCQGEYFIPDTDCDPNPCEQPRGACCYGCEECIADQTEEDCMNIPDWYLWLEGEDCEPNPCPPTATETTTWGSIKANYR
jgi:hypothetical protein